MYNRLLRRVNVKDGTCILVENNFFSGTIENISLGGVFVASKIQLKVRDRVNMCMFLPIDSGGFEIDAVVVATRVENRGIALKYDYLAPKELRKLKSYILRVDGPSRSTH